VSKPYDATSKDLIETDPAGWVAFLGCVVPPSAVRLVDADLSTVTTEADKVIRVDEPERWLLHIDIQTGASGDMERRLLRYNALLHHRHGLPVASVVVLLRKEANMTWLTGQMPIVAPVGPAWEFRYQVLRVWERPAAEFLNGPLGLIPLAPLAEVKASELPRVVSDMRSRIDAQSDRSLAAKLWTATYLLMGLRFDPALVKNVLSGVMQMEESTTYQEILQRGVARGLEQGSTAEAVKALLLQGRKKFKVPATPAHEATLNGIKDLPRLEALLERILDASTWDELLAGA
jgi:predicted transposase YdaD